MIVRECSEGSFPIRFIPKTFYVVKNLNPFEILKLSNYDNRFTNYHIVNTLNIITFSCHIVKVSLLWSNDWNAVCDL